MSICQKADLLHYFPMMASALGTVYTLCGRITHAVPLLTQALEQIIAVEWVGFQSLCSLPLGEAQLLAGRLEEAQTLAERTLALARQHQEQGHQAYALRLLGDIAARHAPPAREQAETHYRQALALADELGMRPLAAHCHNGLGRLYLKTHRQHQARIALATAIALYRAIDMTFWLPQAESALAEICSNDKSRQAAE
jgi:tetratricopeptide (TPR) repeat protein